VRFGEFEEFARAEFERIPEHFLAGVDGLIIDRSARSDPARDGIYTLGECLTEAYPSDFGGPDTTRSSIVLYYGSFLRLSKLDDTFDWRGEIWETLTHELQHHLESLADEDDLGDVDRAMEQDFKRVDGEPFDPWYYRLGEPAGPGAFRLEDKLFIEVEAGDGTIEFEVEGVRAAVDAPGTDADVVFIEIVAGIEPAPDVRELWVVALRPLSLRRRLALMMPGATASVAKAEAVARARG
jgi:hypothetical protein